MLILLGCGVDWNRGSIQQTLSICMCFGQKHKRLLDLLKKKNRKKAPPIYIRGLAWFDRRDSQKTEGQLFDSNLTCRH